MFQSEICDLNGVFNRQKLTLISDSSKSEIIDQKTSLNQFIPVYEHLSELLIWNKRHVLTKSQFSSIPCKINIQYYLTKNLNIPTFKAML